MSSNAISRAPVRREVAAILRDALVGVGLPVAEVYGYRVFDFGGRSPVVVVAPAGIVRSHITMGGTSRDVTVMLDVFVFVRASDASAGVSESDSEDLLDDIEKRIADAVQDNIVNHTPSVANGGWHTLVMSDAARDDSIVDASAGTIGGAVYKRLVIPLQVTRLDG